MEWVSPVIEGKEDGLMKRPDGYTEKQIGDLPIQRIGNFYVSRWKPAEHERKLIAEGGDVYLWIYGNLHPAVVLSGFKPTEQDAADLDPNAEWRKKE